MNRVLLALMLSLSACRAMAIDTSAEEVRGMVKEAFLYGFPMVEGYKTLYKQAIDTKDTNYKGPFNTVTHATSVATPTDTAVVTLNSDTPYSFIWLDLRAEPVVVTMPKIEKGRYYSAQLIDLYTHNFGYLGTRTKGNEGGDYLIAGPNWKGDKPEKLKEVIRCETQFAYVLIRTQLFSEQDMNNVLAVQKGYQIATLSQYMGSKKADDMPKIDWMPLSEKMSNSPQLFTYLKFLLQFCPPHPTEVELRKRFDSLYQVLGAGEQSPEVMKAIEAGIADAAKEVETVMVKLNRGEITSANLFGSREMQKNNYVYRFLGAKVGLYGNDGEEAFYTGAFVDANNQTPNAAKQNYTWTFNIGQLPPNGAFWSITMYDGKTQGLVKNPLNRYLLNSTMMDRLKIAEDGSLTFYLQKSSPGKEKESNWLPAPDGAFYVVLRVYLPKPEVLSGQWSRPQLVPALDPLPSWNDSASKKAILAFVQKVTAEGTTNFVPVSERIAVFDNDGTLWPENPVPFQLAYALDVIKERSASDPKLAADPMVQAANSGDLAKLLEGTHHDGLMHVMALTHAGMTTEDFKASVESWLTKAKHPRFEKGYDQLTYQPMQEVLAYLRANGFKTYIVSGGGADFMRVWTERVYGIPAEQVIGSSSRTKFELRESGPVLVKTLEHLFVDDKEGKPVGIHQFIGRRPIACFGNSDGDKAMLEYTTINNPRPSFGLIVHHTDANREYAYDKSPKSSGKLVEALLDAPKRGWSIVDMAKDWNAIWSGPLEHGATVSTNSIVGKWLAEEIAGMGLLDRAQSTFEVSVDGTVSGSTAVNRYSGKASIEGQKIELGPLATTRRAGPPALMEQESKFTAALEKASSFRIEDTGLMYLLDSEGKVLLRFSKLEN